jgi:hypothetical protein
MQAALGDHVEDHREAPGRPRCLDALEGGLLA